MTTVRWLSEATSRLQQASIATARLDSLVLLEDVSGRDRAWLLAHPEFELSAAQRAKLQKLLNRRARHEPLAYIRGKIEFYGREFVLTPAVLQPRPESETMIDLLKALPPFKAEPGAAGKPARKNVTQLSIADVGTGSGALGITAALELSNITVDLLEINVKAIKIAQLNVDKFTLTLRVIKSNLLGGSAQTYDILLCNLPYVPDDYQINQSAAKEPSIAIFGGPDGLDIYRRLFAQVKELSNKPLYILTEALPPQHADLAGIAKEIGYKLQKTSDFIQVFNRISVHK